MGLAAAAALLVSLPAAAGQIAEALYTPEEGRLSGLITRLDQRAFGEGEAFAGSVEMLGASLEERARAREEKIAEASRELEETLAAAEQQRGEDPGQHDIKLSEALQSAAVMQELATDKDAVLTDPRVRSATRQAERAAEAAEARGDWLIANELYFRLDALHEDAGRYTDDVDRLNDRLGMVRLYAPERYWELGNRRRVLSGEDEAPPYNPLGDGFGEKLEPISAKAVFQAIEHAAGGQVDRDRDTRREMLRAGLESVETMATTQDLWAAFPRLGDPARRERFLSVVRELIGDYGPRNRSVGRDDVIDVITVLLTANGDTVRILDQALLHEFGDGAMSVLDEYSYIIWPDEIKRFERTTKGEFVGVGVQIEMDKLQNIRVVTPLEGTPAQRAGVRSGDVIRQVDGNSTLGFTLDQAVEVITGERNTPVTLTVERGEGDDSEEIDITIVRNVIDLPTVKGWRKTRPGDGPESWDWFVDPRAGIGYVRLSSFSEKTTRDFDRAVAAMRRRGLRALVLDLRFNPGGLLDQAVSVSSRFVPPSGLVVKTEDARGFVRDRQRASRLRPEQRLDDIPVAVLINRGSASASEIVSGAIQAHSRKRDGDEGLRAWLIGEQTFGKDSVQNVWPIADRTAAMRLTTHYYRLLGDDAVHGEGAEKWTVRPDITVTMLPDQVVESVRVRRDADVIPLDENGRVIAGEERPDPDKLLEPDGDLQLQTALALLRAESRTPGIALLDAVDAEAARR